MRGICPAEWTVPPHFPYDESLPDYDPLIEADEYVVGDRLNPKEEVFLDGSGGKFSKDPRLRRCGWAWCQVSRSTLTFLRGQSGVLQAITQTVPRAETMALEYAIRAILASDVRDIK